MAETAEGASAPTEEMVAPDQFAQLLGWDTTRAWANNVQVFKNPNHILFVFREIVEVEGVGQNGEVKKGNLGKNTASVIMPLDVAQSFAEVMKRLFLDDNAEQQPNQN